MPTWIKVLLVLAILFVLGIAAVGGAGYYFFRKIADEPGGPVAAMVRMANPDYEVLDVNEQDKTMTVRHKKTGKQATIPLERLRRGALNPKDLGMTNEEAGVKAPPAWAQYPGSTLETTAGNARGTQMTFKTDDPSEKVFDYYEKQLKANGYDVTSVSLTRTLLGSSKDGHHNVTVQILPGGKEQTGVLLMLQDKP